MVCSHDRQSLSVNDGALERWQIGGQELALSAVDWTSVDSLLGGCKGSLALSVSASYHSNSTGRSQSV
jgi:hypothetical protein